MKPRNRAKRRSESLVSSDLLAVLACPVCKASVKRADEGLVCVKCKRRYEVRQGIPVMMVEDLHSKRGRKGRHS